MLLPELLLDVFDVLRKLLTLDPPNPVFGNCDREVLPVSPARSASVFLLLGGSGTIALC
jgi:hypothetical protein